MKKLILLSSALLSVVFLAGCGTQPTTPAPTAEQKEQPIAVADETADWTSYTNEEFGFTISYPSAYHIYLDHNLINYDENKYERGDPNGVKIQIQKNNGGNLGYDLSTADGIKKLVDELNADRVENDAPETSRSTPIISSPLGVFQFKNKWLSGPGGEFSVYYAITNSDAHTVLVWNEQNDQETINKILSTFKQTPTVQSTADWKTYTNTDYGYLIKYPSTWTVDSKAKDRRGKTIPIFLAPGMNNAPGDKMVGIQVNPTTNVSRIDSADYIKRNGNMIISTSPVVVGGVSTDKFIINSNKEYDMRVYVEKNSETYSFELYNTTSSDKEYIDNFNLMLSSFQFTK